MRATDLESLIALDGEEGDTGELVLADIQRAMDDVDTVEEIEQLERRERFKDCGKGEMGVVLFLVQKEQYQTEAALLPRLFPHH